MRSFKFKLWLVLTIIGLAGVASLLLSELPLGNLPEEVIQSMSPDALKLLILINPAINVIICTIVGTLLYDKVNFSVPVLEKLLNKPDSNDFSIVEILKQGIIFGVLAGVLIIGVSLLFEVYLPPALKDINASIATKILYGGITEELLMRFGLMSLIVWLLFKVTKKLNPLIYWSAISIVAVLFALGHLPMVFQVIAEPTLAVYAYIIIGNSVGGLLFGYVYWKNGLECAFVAHSMAHVTMVILGLLVN